MLDEDRLTQNFTNIDGLSRLLTNANISIESLLPLLEREKEMRKRKEILAQHSSPITQLPSGKWYTRINGKKIQRNKLEDLENAIINHYQVPAFSMRTIFPMFLERRKNETEGTTWSKDISYYNQYILTSEISDIPLSKLTLDDGYAFLQHCKDIKPDITKKYWDNVSSSLNKLFQYAIDESIISTNPFSNMSPKRDFFVKKDATREADTVFTVQEQAVICSLAGEDASSKSKSEPLGITLAFNSGLRIGELCALKWCDIETTTHGHYLHIQREMVTHINELGKPQGYEIVDHCKTVKSERRLLLNDNAVSTLELVKKINNRNGISTEPGDYIFQRKKKDEFLYCTPRSFDPRIRRFCRKAGMTTIKSMHDIRRTVLTTLYTCGMPLKKIQEYAGHSSLKQTMDYIRITDDELDTMQFLNQLGQTASPCDVIYLQKEA